MIAILCVLQPAARLRGRLDHGLTPWRRRGYAPLALPRPRLASIWSERWQAGEARPAVVDAALRSDGVAVAAGGEFDRWDLQVRGGILGAARMRMALEEHGQGRQLVRFRVWPRASNGATALCGVLAVLTAGASLQGAWQSAAWFAGIAAVALIRTGYEAAVATGALLRALREHADATPTLATELTRRLRATPLGANDGGETP